jgi:hypothetical protein
MAPVNGTGTQSGKEAARNIILFLLGTVALVVALKFIIQ